MIVDKPAHFREFWHQVCDLGEGAHAVVDPAFLLHPRRVLEEIARGVATEPLPGANPPKREIHVGAPWRIA